MPRMLSARSVILSVLLGSDPPRLPPRRIVRATALFDVSEGATRTALSRLVERGELSIDGDGWYSLGDHHRARQDRQRSSVAGDQLVWSGRWRLAVVEEGQRSAPDRARLRAELANARFAELRDGVWTRPDNLIRTATPAADAQCRWFDSAPTAHDDNLAASLWDLDAWAAQAEQLRRRLHLDRAEFDDPEPDTLRRGFETAAEVLRHFQHDPLLPRELLDRRWPGDRLRRDFADYDIAFRSALLRWLEGGTSLDTER